MAKDFGGVPVITNPLAGDVLADEALGFEFVNGTIRITLASARMADGSPPSDMQLVVIGRLVMGFQPAQRLAMGLFDYLKKIEADAAGPSGTEPTMN
jgi:hypothetical protein